MNFMSGRPGFYEEIADSSSRGFSSYGGGAAQPPDSSPTYNNGGGGGGDETPEDSDDHMLFRRGGGEGSSSAAPAASAVIQREHMFDKVVTPSDVGKLNRLVIPKQHAEKYFPLDSSTNEKGLLLNFEDRNGKAWRFRYSYWNSSQSYVMTKGWSRFVKEKKLDAGDIVSFQRGVGDLSKDRLFIDWRRRPDAPELPHSIHHHGALSIPGQFSFGGHRSSIHPWSPLFMQPSRDYSHLLQPANSITAFTTHHNQNYHHHQHHPPIGYGPYAYNSAVVNGNPCPPGSIVYLRSAVGGAAGGGGGGGVGVLGPQRGGGGSGAEGQMVFESVPVVQGKAAAKRLRLFGVNMDCPISESDECDILSSATLTHPTMPPPPPLSSSSSFPSLQLRPNNYQDDDKGKGSMSLDLDI